MKDQKSIEIKTGQSFWDILQWIALFTFLVYLLLLVTGKLHSPLGIDLVGIASIGYFLGKQIQKLNRVIKDLDELKLEFKTHISDKRVHRI